MTTVGKWILGIGIVGLGVAAIVHFNKNKNVPKPEAQPEPSKPLTDDDWNALIKAAVDSEKRTGKSNAISKLAEKPVLMDMAKKQFLQNVTRDKYDKLMTVIVANKSDDATVVADRDKMLTDLVVSIVGGVKA